MKKFETREEAIEFLKEHGYIVKEGQVQFPQRRSTNEELDAIAYLVEEWGYLA